jgi:hypothetical protein
MSLDNTILESKGNYGCLSDQFGQFWDTLYNTPVQTNGADGFKLALYLISRGLEGIDASIVHNHSTTK